MTARRTKNGGIIAGSVAEILAEAGIQLGRQKIPAPGGTARVLCPVCNGGKARELSLSLKIDEDGMGATWQCHRGTCPSSPGWGRVDDGRAGRLRADAPPPQTRRPEVVPVQPHPPEIEASRPPGMLAWFAKRGISEETVAEFGIYGMAMRWPEKRREGGEVVWVDKPTIVFPYRLGGVLVSRKYRSADKQFRQDPGSLRSLFNADSIADDVLVIVEGEMDVLACWEAGLRSVVSLPDGAPNKENENVYGSRYEALTTCHAAIEKIPRIVIATDMDQPGSYLAEDLAERLGKHRCWRVRWPDGCKDANDVLVKHGRDALVAAVEAAEPWPLVGAVVIEPGQLRAFLNARGMPKGLESGVAALDSVVRLPDGGGWLTIVTGIPSMGKTTFLRGWLAYLATRHDLHLIWSSAEDNRAEILALGLASVVTGLPAYDGPSGPGMSDAELEKAETWLRRHVTILHADDDRTEMTLDWLTETAALVAKRHAGQRRYLILDPWNEVEHNYGRGETEAQYTGKWLRRLKAWSRANGVGVIIVAHPTKLLRQPGKTELDPPTAYDISGGAMWFNKADLIICIHRHEEGIISVYNQKSRFPAFGRRGAKAEVALDLRCGRLSTPMGRSPQRDDEEG
jgi:twinkle protein